MAKTISLIELQKKFLQAQKEKIKQMKGGVLVTEVPKSWAGNIKDDKHYITVDALVVDVRGLF